MKFQKPENFKHWTTEQTESQIDFVMNEVANFNREMNNINSKINVLLEQKRVIKVKIANKNKYINQLKFQLEEDLWKEL